MTLSQKAMDIYRGTNYNRPVAPWVERLVVALVDAALWLKTQPIRRWIEGGSN